MIPQCHEHELDRFLKGYEAEIKAELANREETESGPSLKSLTDLQSIRGYWSDVQKVIALVGIKSVEPFDELRGHENSSSIFASVLAVAILRKRLQSQRSSWSLIESKCLKWLSCQGIDAEPLITRAMALIP
jgi:hypothetical protein